MSEQMTPIDAEERLAAITDQSVAAGVVKKHAAQQHHRELTRAADRPRPATSQDLAAMGITVVKA